MNLITLYNFVLLLLVYLHVYTILRVMCRQLPEFKCLNRFFFFQIKSNSIQDSKVIIGYYFKSLAVF